MERSTSVYLDLVRFIAALAVFVGHVSSARFTGGLFWQVAPYMAPAVAIFFVLSGYVIGHVTERREVDAATYATNRLARIASVCLPAIVLTLTLDTIGRAVSPGLYSLQWGYTAAHPLLQIATALTFTQRLWWCDLTIGSDLPYWSLNNEVAYYLLFGVATFGLGRVRVALLALLALAYGPPILLLLPLWLLGLLAFRLPARPGRRAGWLLVAGAFASYVAYETWSWHSGRILATLGPASRPEIAQDYLVAILFVASLTGVRAVAPDLTGLVGLLGPPSRWLAGRTFSLYLYHLPVAQFLAAVNPLPPAHPLSRVIVLGGTLAVVAVLARYTELRKEPWRRWIATALAQLAWSRVAARGG